MAIVIYNGTEMAAEIEKVGICLKYIEADMDFVMRSIGIIKKSDIWESACTLELENKYNTLREQYNNVKLKNNNIKEYLANVQTNYSGKQKGNVMSYTESHSKYSNVDVSSLVKNINELEKLF